MGDRLGPVSVVEYVDRGVGAVSVLEVDRCLKLTALVMKAWC